MYVPYSRPNGWTEWADIFIGNPWGVTKAEQILKFIFFKNLFFL